MSIVKGLGKDTRDFWAQKILRVHNPEPSCFLRDYVSLFTPTVITGLIDNWPASRWSLNSLKEKIIGPVSVNLTPDGHGDCVKYIDDQRYFVYPLEEVLNVDIFTDMLLNRQSGDAVPYLSGQDDNLRKFFPELMNELDDSIGLANEIFGSNAHLEAVNLWIGDDRAVSSVHRDFFENFYAVLDGEKTFILLPPTDIAFLPLENFPTLRYHREIESEDDKQSLKRVKANSLTLSSQSCPSDSIPWIDFDPYSIFCNDSSADGHNQSHVARPPFPSTILARDDNAIESKRHAENLTRYRGASPLYCTVRAGEVLYIPAMWYHRVSQTRVTVAVNFWYDMRFDFR